MNYNKHSKVFLGILYSFLSTVYEHVMVVGDTLIFKGLCVHNFFLKLTLTDKLGTNFTNFM